MRVALLAAALCAATAPAMAADVGVSVTVGQPGFYGRIDIGTFPSPRLIYAEPMVIYAPRPGVPVPRPIYLHVPPGHAKDWRKHCSKYNACGQPVYFVQESWYNEVYVPHMKGGGRGGGKGADKGGPPPHAGGKPGQGNGNPGKGKGKGND